MNTWRLRFDVDGIMPGASVAVPAGTAAGPAGGAGVVNAFAAAATAAVAVDRSQASRPTLCCREKRSRLGANLAP